MSLKKEITEQIRDLLRQHPGGLNITAIVRHIRINRNTAGRYLENLMVSGQVEMRHFGMSKIYRLAQRVPLSAMLSITSGLIMLLDCSSRVIYANEPMLAFLGTTRKDLYGRNIEYTPVLNVFDDAFDLLKEKIREGSGGNEWRGELVLLNRNTVFSCRIAPAVFEEGQHAISVLLEDITEKKNAEHRIRERERQFRLLTENSLDMISRHTPDGVCTYVSPACRTILGYEPEELIGHFSPAFLHPADLPAIEASLGRLTREQPSATETYRRRHRQGHYVWLETRILAVFDERSGTMTEIYGVARDITERKRAEAALRESEERFRSITEYSPDLILLINLNWEIQFINHTFAFHPDQVLKRSVLDFIPEEFQTTASACFDRVRTTGTPASYGTKYRFTAGETGFFESTVGPVFRNTDVVALVINARDVTREKRAEQALRESEATYRSLAEASHDLIFMIGPDDRVLYVNSHAAALVGRPVSEITGTLRSSIFSPELSQRQEVGLRQVVATGRPFRSEGPMLVRGESRWFDHYLMPVPDPDGGVRAVVGVSRDVTERKLTAEALEKSEELLHDLITTTADIVWQTDEESRFLYISPQVERILGYPPADLLGKTPFPFLEPSSVETNRQAFGEAVRAHRSILSHESCWIHRDGHRVILESRAAPVYRKDGTFAGFRGIDRDVTEHRQTEEALRKTARAFRMLAESSVDLISRIRADGTCVYVSPAITQSLGYAPDEVIGRPGFEYLHPDDRSHVLDMVRSFEMSGTSTGTDRFRMRHKNGSYVLFEATIRALRDEKTGAVKEFTIVSRSLGDRHTS